MTTARDLIFTFSTETWADATARQFCRPPDRLAQAVLRSPEIERAIIAEPWRSRPALVASRLMRRRRTVPSPVGASLASPRRWRRRDPVDTEGLERSYRAYASHLRRAADQAGLRRPAILTCHPLVAGFAPLDWASSTTYFARDDWSAYPPHERWWPAYREAYRRLAKRGTRVAAVSSVLLDRIAPTGPSVVVPNAVDATTWLTPRAAPAAVRDLPRPRYVYAGTLDDRLDITAVRALAERLREGVVVLIGPVPDSRHLAALGATPRVRILPAMDQADLVGALSGMDVALIPHRVTALTEAMSPLKLYEYLAAGLPVATVDIVPSGPAPDRLVRYTGPGDLPEAAAGALRLGRWSESDRTAFIADNSWDARQQAVLALALSR